MSKYPEKGLIRVLVVVLVIAAAGIYWWYVYAPAYTQYQTPSLVVSENSSDVATWQGRAQMPTQRTEVSGAHLGNRIYAVGGLSGFSSTLATVESYDLVSDSWSQATDMPMPRHHASTVALDGRLYVIGGHKGLGFTPQSEVFVFDPAANAWSGSVSLPEGRGAHGAAVIDGAIYIAGGVTDSGVSADLLRWRPGDARWQQLPAMPTPREHLAVASIGNKLLVAGGRQGSPANNLGTLEIFDVESGEWASGPDMPTARGGVTGTATDNLFIISGGESTTKTFNEVEAYDLTTDQWQSLPPLPTARHGLLSAVVDNTLYVIGGGRRPGLSVSGVNEKLILSSDT